MSTPTFADINFLGKFSPYKNDRQCYESFPTQYVDSILSVSEVGESISEIVEY